MLDLSEKNWPKLPPQTCLRLNRIIRNHALEIVHMRSSVVLDQRGNGYPFWRLYLETGSGYCRRRRRVYVGKQGGKELRQTIRRLKKEFWGPCGGPRGFRKAMAHNLENGAVRTRRALRASQDTLLAQTFRHRHGRQIRAQRNVPAVKLYRAEYGHVSRKALEEATWPGITEAQYIKLRRVADHKVNGLVCV